MLFMNEWDIADAQAKWAPHPILGPATRTLSNLCDVTNANSDGWPYWPKPARAAKNLMELIQTADREWRAGGDPTVTRGELLRAYVPIKSFSTRTGLAVEIIQPDA